MHIHGTIVFTGILQILFETARNLATTQMHAIRMLACAPECMIVEIIILFDRTPVIGIDELKRISTSILIVCNDETVGNATLHIVGTAGKEKISVGETRFSACVS